jgi:hypothetical protein
MSKHGPGEERHLEVTEQDASPDVMNVVKLVVSNSTLVDLGNGAVQVSTGGGGGAPANSQYVTLALDATLTNERVLTAGAGISITDGGPNGNVTIATTAETSSRHFVYALMGA